MWGLGTGRGYVLNAWRIVRHFILLIALALGACGMSTDRDGSAARSVFDDPNLPRWEFDPTPVLEIGGEDEREGYALERVGDAVLLEGKLAVADRGAGEVRVYSLGGELMFRSGRSGDGPGEYRTITALASSGDSIMIVWDFLLRRFTHLDATSGEVLAMITADLSSVKGMGLGIKFVGVMGGGRYAFREERDDWSLRNAPNAERRDSVRYLVLEPDGKWRGVEWKELGDEVYFRRDENSWGTSPVIFGRTAQAAAIHSGLVVGATDSLSLTLRGIDGSVLRTVSLPGTEAKVLPEWEKVARKRQFEEEDARVSRMFARIGGADAPAMLATMKRSLQARYREIPARRTLPAFAALEADALGRVWVAESVPPDARTRRWVVLDTLLAPVAVVEMPSDIDILHIRGDRVVSLAVDELGVQAVRVHRVVPRDRS